MNEPQPGERVEPPTDYVADWLRAADERSPLSRWEVLELQDQLRSKYPIRWPRMQRDMRWLRKRMRKMGRNPDDARWLL